MEYVSPVYENKSLSRDDFIQNFQTKIGEKVYSKKDLEISEFRVGDVNHFRYKFSIELEVENSIDIEIKAKIIKPLIDKSYSLYVRHPTNGYSAKLSYKNEYKYACNWFRFWDKNDDIMESILDGKVFSNGISVISRKWLLPGEGVVLEFH